MRSNPLDEAKTVRSIRRVVGNKGRVTQKKLETAAGKLRGRTLTTNTVLGFADVIEDATKQGRVSARTTGTFGSGQVGELAVAILAAERNTFGGTA